MKIYRLRYSMIAVTLLLTFAAVVSSLTAATTVSGQPPTFVGATNVKDFRAAGDGVTDDTAAIKRALATALQSKGTLYFPAGVYLISDTLEVTDTVTIAGSGWGSVLMLKPAVRRIMLAVQAQSSTGETVGFRLSNLAFDGNLGGQLDAGLIQINSAVGFVVDHVWVRNGGRPGESRSQGVDGIAVAVRSTTNLVASRGVITNSLIEKTTKPGILWSTHASDGLVSGNILRGQLGNSQTPCLAVSEGRNVTIVGNSMSGCEGSGISIANGGNNVPPLHVIVTGNHVYSNGTGSVEGNGIQIVNGGRDRDAFISISDNVVFDNGGPTTPDGHGIFVQNVDHVVVKGNVVRNSRRTGIVLYNVNGGIVQGNYVFGNNRLGTPEHSGIMLQHVTRLLLTGNFVSDDAASPTQAYGLFFSGMTPSDRLWVTDNVLYPNKHAPWHGHVMPTNTVFIGNRTADTTQLAVGPPTATEQLEITARPSANAPTSPAGAGQPALYLDVRYGGKTYKLPLYNP